MFNAAGSVVLVQSARVGHVGTQPGRVMSNDSGKPAGDQKPTPVPWPATFVALTALAGGYYLLPAALTSSRPSPGVLRRHATTGAEEVDARLWQDPFAAVHVHLKQMRDQETPGEDSHLHTVEHFQHELQKRLEEREVGEGVGQGGVLLLPVMLSAGPYAEDVENRLRLRYALLAALQSQGYFPFDNEHIGYFSLNWPNDADMETRDGSVSADEIDDWLELPLSGATAHLVVPFEWYGRLGPDPAPTGQEWTAVAVLWIPEDQFASFPLERLAALLRTVSRDPKTGELTADPTRVETRILGPASSTTLRRILTPDDLALFVQRDWTMLEYVSENGQVAAQVPEQLVRGRQRPRQTYVQLNLQREQRGDVIGSGDGGWFEKHPNRRTSPAGVDFDLLSFRSTVADHRLRGLFETPGTLRETLARLWIDRRTRRTILTDDTLAYYLADELIRRDPDLLSGDDEPYSIALITEWDTDYGRAWPETFCAAWDKRVGELDPSRKDDDSLVTSCLKDTHRKQIKWFTYLRGVDGEAPVSADATLRKLLRRVAEESAAAAGDKAKASSPPPEGSSQIDYIMRLVAHLDRLDHGMQPDGSYKPQLARFSGRRLRAIGVLGSDVYDKLLLLRALRKKFPHALFFTTDLDARYFDAAELDWSRNLIVASAFGLKLRDRMPESLGNFRLQENIPPFRDSYQTSLFFSTVLALRMPELRDNVELDEILASLTPRMYEIGLDGPVDLSFRLVEGKPIFKDKVPSPHLPRPLHLPWAYWACVLSIIAAVLLVTVLLLWLSTSARRLIFPITDSDRLRRKHFFLFLFVPGLFAAAIAIAFGLCYERDRGEPFALLQGVSIWPTEGIRMLATFLAITFLFQIREYVSKSEKAVRERFGFPEPSTPQPHTGAGHGDQSAVSLWRWRKDISIAHWKRSGDAPPDLDVLWLEYLRRSSLSARLVRLAPPLLLFFLLSTLLMQLFGRPIVPVRDEFSRSLDTWVLIASVMAMLIVVFVVGDVTRLVCRFLDHVRDAPLNEPTLKRREVAQLIEERGLPDRDAHAWVRLELVGEITRNFGTIVFYPFMLLFLLAIARNRYFDHWDWPPSLILIFLFSTTYVLGCGLALAGGARKVRDEICQGINRQLHKCHRLGDTPRADQLKWLLAEVREFKIGALQPITITRNPIVVPLLLGVGSVAVPVLLEHLSRFPLH